jgi:hypothetical protein
MILWPDFCGKAVITFAGPGSDPLIQNLHTYPGISSTPGRNAYEPRPRVHGIFRIVK